MSNFLISEQAPNEPCEARIQVIMRRIHLLVIMVVCTALRAAAGSSRTNRNKDRPATRREGGENKEDNKNRSRKTALADFV